MFTLQIKTGNAAFGYDREEATREVVRVLKKVIDQIQYGYDEKAIMDINGNKVGEWRFDFE